MASINLNPVIESIRGKFGNMVFKRLRDHEFVARVPVFPPREPSEAEKAVREKFRQAAVYGKTVMADPQARAVYEKVAKAKKRSLFSFIMKDFLVPPSIEEVDLSAYSGQAGEKIFVRAGDDFDVVAVHVAISKASGEPIEAGTAVKSAVDAGRWTYTTTASVTPGTPVKIEIGATDRPGHTVTKTETK